MSCPLLDFLPRIPNCGSFITRMYHIQAIKEPWTTNMLSLSKRLFMKRSLLLCWELRLLKLSLVSWSGDKAGDLWCLWSVQNFSPGAGWLVHPVVMRKPVLENSLTPLFTAPQIFLVAWNYVKCHIYLFMIYFSIPYSPHQKQELFGSLAHCTYALTSAWKTQSWLGHYSGLNCHQYWDKEGLK